MKTIYFIFLTVYIIGSIFFTLSTYYEHPYRRAEYVYATLGGATLLGGFIFGGWSLAMWANHLW